MKLYSSPGSPNAMRSRAVIFELGAPVEIVDLNLSKAENRTPEFLAINPNGKVPTLVDGDVTLWESRAINAYVAGKTPGQTLYPADLAARAQVDQWSYWQSIHLGPTMQKVAFERVQKKLFGRGEPDETAIAGDVKTVAELLAIFDAALAGRDWITGSLSLADFALATTFTLRGPARLGVENFPNASAWMDRMEARPSWQKAVTPMYELLRARGADL